MQKPISIRQASVHDIPVMIEICKNTFIESARHSAVAINIFRAAFTGHPGWQWVAEMDGAVAGFIVCNRNETEGFANINLIGVDPCAKGTGIGGKLLDVLEKHTAASRLNLVRLGTPYARTFYEKYGYTCAKIDEKYVIELVGKPLPPLPDCVIQPILPTDLPQLLPLIPAEIQFDFLTAYYRYTSPALSFLMRAHGAPLGLGLLATREHENCDVPGGIPGLVTLAFHHLFPGADPASLISAAIRTATYNAAARLGVAIDENDPLRATLHDFGFTLSAHPAFWTMYTMEKEI